MNLLEIKAIEFDGYKFACTDNGAIIFSKKTNTGYLEMRCLSSDLTNGNLHFMAKHGLTNTNPATKADKNIYK